MSFSNELVQHEQIMQCLTTRCSKLFGSTAMPVEVDWNLQRLIQPRLRRVGTASLVSARPLITLDSHRRGHRVGAGLQLCRLPIDGREIDVIEVTLPYQFDLGSFWCVRAEDYRKFYRHIRAVYRNDIRQSPPILPSRQLQQLTENTVHFLRRDPSVLERLQIPVRRGLLLTGPPGNGKTMSCRWLRYECVRRGLSWKSVSRLEYEEAAKDGGVRDLFSLYDKGVILFDDFDAALRDRSKYGDELQSTFLAELDGMSGKHGIVFLFTSNLRPEEIDPAALRPGRIDVIISFPSPDAELRRKLFEERWQSEVVSHLPVAALVEATDGWSFAELEELRKMLALRVVDGNEMNWEELQLQIHRHPRQAVTRRGLGFASVLSGLRELVPPSPAAELIKKEPRKL
jgi:hypothetical protein